MSDDSVFTPEEAQELQEVQQVRRRLIADLTKDGVPQKGQVFLASLLDGVDRQALSRAKLRHDKSSAENTQATAKLMAEMLKSINIKTHRPVARSEDRQIPADLAIRTFVPGEMDIGNDPLSIEQVIDKT